MHRSVWPQARCLQMDDADQVSPSRLYFFVMPGSLMLEKLAKDYKTTLTNILGDQVAFLDEIALGEDIIKHDVPLSPGFKRAECKKAKG